MGTNAVLVPKSTVIERLFTLIPQDGNPARRLPTRIGRYGWSLRRRDRVLPLDQEVGVRIPAPQPVWPLS